MTDRDRELETLAERVSEHEAVADAWLAKSFTDRLFVVDVHPDRDLPTEVRDKLADHDLYGSHRVYGTDDSEESFVGALENGSRHQFVDVRTRGDHQSYVVD